jgi:hypothetical protein
MCFHIILACLGNGPQLHSYNNISSVCHWFNFKNLNSSGHGKLLTGVIQQKAIFSRLTNTKVKQTLQIKEIKGVKDQGLQSRESRKTTHNQEMKGNTHSWMNKKKKSKEELKLVKQLLWEGKERAVKGSTCDLNLHLLFRESKTMFEIDNQKCHE